MNQYRSVLEVLKLTDQKSILTSTEVCSIWFRAASSEELYREKCELEIFGLNSQVSYLSAKAMYQSYLQTKTLLIGVNRSSIRYYACKKRRWNPSVYLKHALKADYGSAWTLLPDGSILTCGGRDPYLSADLSEVNLLMSGGEVKELTPMIETKRYHMCIFFKNAVYVFGGINDRSLNPPSNEKLAISTLPIMKTVPWKGLPDMLHPRSQVCPCGHGTFIYLFGKGIPEIFHCVEEIYSLLAISLPPNSTNYGVLYNGEIVCLDMHRITKWNLESNEVTSITIVRRSGNAFYPERTAASIAVDDTLFVRDMESSTRMIDLVTGVLTTL